MIDTVELHARIAARPEAFVATLFGDAASANKSGDEWRVGKNGSLKISLYNGRLGFCDFEGDAKRKDAVELWERVARLRGMGRARHRFPGTRGATGAARDASGPRTDSRHAASRRRRFD
jgi:hypothetical protein